LEQAEGNKKTTADAVARLWGSKPTSDKGCHPFYEFPFDSAKICRIFFLQKLSIERFVRKYKKSSWSPVGVQDLGRKKH
jgi:hypothetical protein